MEIFQTPVRESTEQLKQQLEDSQQQAPQHN